MDSQLEQFDAACRDVADCGLIVARAHIGSLLKTVASSPEVLAVIRRVTAGYDFATEFNRSKAPCGMNGYRLILPGQIGDFVAYAFGILLHIDLGDLELAALLTTYFKDAGGDVNASYARFGAEIVDKFRRAVETLYEGAKPKPSEPSVYPRTPVLDGESIGAVREILSDCVTTLAGLELPVRHQEELMVVCDGLSGAVASGDKSLVYLLYIGFKYALGSVDGLETYVESVYNVLTRSRLI